MFAAIFQDSDVTKKILETILEGPSGRRSLSRLARTCRAFCEPALDVLWRELDSLTPLVGLFPTLMKKAHKPNMGLVRAPGKDDWKTFDQYSGRVRRITYDERVAGVVSSIFAMLNENKPREFILPNLEEVSWKVETPAGLARCAMFLNPNLRALHLEIAVRLPQLNAFLQDVSNRMKLASFSFISPTTLPDTFTDLLNRQDILEKIVLVAPGALSPEIGRWLASLPRLRHLQLDLSGRSMIAVEGFFDELLSGYSTPSSVTSTDSGVFSGEDLDFSEIRKSALRLTGDLPPRRIFHQLRRLQLTGEISNIAVFLKHITSPLTSMEFIIEDPPDRADWQDFCALIGERFQGTLTALRITATSTSRFVDLVRSTQRGEPASNRLSLEYLRKLPHLTRLEIDLPESIIFTSADYEKLASSCPKLEFLRLCPLAKFPQTIGPPQVSLDDLAILLINCPNLHTVAAVLNATPLDGAILAAQQVSSNSLMRLQVGHSWISEPVQVAVSLSHLAPRLESLKWFQEKTRQAHWQSVWDLLPYFQNVRMVERRFAIEFSIPNTPRKVDKSVDATVKTVNRSVDAQPFMVNSSVQAAAKVVNRMVEVKPTVFSVSVDATPVMSCASVEATITVQEQSIDATEDASKSRSMEASTSMERALTTRPSSILHMLSFLYRILILYPLSIPSRILHLTTGRYRRWRPQGPSPPLTLTQVQKEMNRRTGKHDDTPKALGNGDSIELSSVPVRH
ncbi:hypothetical protein AMATHDRAFT_134138 [Amanita thiersii Skay4041]|uniref:F-box domain-containing protein n=1 Tax=Amanita thiersii Skay4041 TaxID=703135 RepID=A0A2A9NW83_9AGAR|nr:hypothetical protein AMATHDRAFT_134138 [Amanita thiersii Skay4041]